MATLKLSLLGGFEARLDSSPELVFPTRKAKALLAYLALHPGRSCSREDVSGLLWSNSGDEQARACLRQTLSLLRKTLNGTGTGGLAALADGIRLEPDWAEVDVAAFMAAAKGVSPESWEAAAALYKGELLAGFALREQPFQDWLATEREWLQVLALGVLTKLLAHYERIDAVGRAVEVATRLLAVDAFQEDVHRTLMRLYLRQGRRGLARRQFEMCREVLNQELGICPEQETIDLYQSMKSNGRNGDGTGAGHRNEASRASPAIHARAHTGRSQLTSPTVAVRPMICLSEGTEKAHFAGGLTDDLITALSNWRLFAVLSNPADFGKARSPTSPIIGSWMGAQYILGGSVRWIGSQIRIAIQLIDAETSQHIWAKRIDRTCGDVLAVQDEIARDIAAMVQPEVAWAEQMHMSEHPDQAWASDDYFQVGLSYFWQRTPSTMPKARRSFTRAIELGQHHSQAFAALSTVLHCECIFGSARVRPAFVPRMLAAAQRAVEYDHNNAWANQALAVALFWSGQQEAAISLCRRSLELNPGDVESYVQLGSLLDFTGNTQQAVSSMEAVRRLPRTSRGLEQRLALCYLHAQEFEAAVAAAREAIASSPDYSFIYVSLAASLGHLGQTDEARDVLKKGEALRSGFVENWHEWPLHRIPEQKQIVLDGLRKAGWRGQID